MPGLYLHIPFCSEICPYCDFAVRKGGPDQGGLFVGALQSEIRGLRSGELLPEAPELAETVSQLVEAPFDTVYLGGGTPSFLSPDELSRLFDTLFRVFHLESGCRFYLEANPEDVEPERLKAWRRLGIDTLSLGIQSLDDERLRFLGRRHDGDEARRAVREARAEDFHTVSVDLIYGVPGQTLSAWREELAQALELGADHLSLYELEFHPRTTFGKKLERGEMQESAEETRADLFVHTHEALEQAGWDIYEVSNFARDPEFRSRHNAKYWRHVPYLGLGPSAHSYMAGWRFWNERSEPAWRRLIEDGTSPAMGWEKVPDSALDLERLMLGLRVAAGVDLERLQSTDAAAFLSQNEALLEGWRQRAWVTVEDDRYLVPSTRGMALADRLAGELEL